MSLPEDHGSTGLLRTVVIMMVVLFAQNSVFFALGGIAPPGEEELLRRIKRIERVVPLNKQEATDARLCEGIQKCFSIECTQPRLILECVNLINDGLEKDDSTWTDRCPEGFLPYNHNLRGKKRDLINCLK